MSAELTMKITLTIEHIDNIQTGDVAAPSTQLSKAVAAETLFQAIRALPHCVATEAPLSTDSSSVFDYPTAPEPHRPVPVLVQTLSGKTIVLETWPSITLSDLRLLIQAREHIPASMQVLVFAGKQLPGHANDENGSVRTQPLEWYGIERNSKLHLVLKIRGS